MINGFKMVTLRNYLLTNKEVGLFRIKRENNTGFEMDFFVGNLMRYRGQSVAYCNGNLCGHCEDSGNRLLNTAVQTYGQKKEITVYQVPKLGESLESVINKALRHNKR